MSKVLVVGAAGGVGMAVVRALVDRGESVVATVLNDTEQASLHAVFGDQVVSHQVDLGKPEETAKTVAGIIANLDGLDGVAVCAAIAPYGPVETTPLSVLRAALEINCVADVAIFQAAMPALRKSAGRIVFISSMAGRAAMPFVGAYVASKYALEGIADVMRREVADQGVKVSLVEPGGIRTGMVEEQLRTIKDRIANLSVEESERYGYLYRGFQHAASQSHQNTASTPEQVATVVIEALTVENPQTRYLVGDDARQLIDMVKLLPDLELDGVFRQMFGSS